MFIFVAILVLFCVYSSCVMFLLMNSLQQSDCAFILFIIFIDSGL